MSRFVCNPAILKTLPLFSWLRDAELAALLPRVEHRRYADRAVITRACERADGLYVILAGHVRQVLDDGNGRELIIAILGPREFFGETGLLNDGLHASNVQTQESCEVLYVPRNAVLECLRTNPNAALAMLGALLGRLSAAQRKLQRIGLMDVYGRVAHVLLETGRECHGEWVVEPGAEQIAAMVGASREMVSRVLNEMIRRAVVRRERRKLIVLDREALEERSWRDRPALPAQKKDAVTASNRPSSEALV
jgi:CRP/FNR family cyclic AMP-dependent transcriptional regulator